MNYLLSSRPTGEILSRRCIRSLPLVEMTFLYYMVLNLCLFAFICGRIKKPFTAGSGCKQSFQFS